MKEYIKNTLIGLFVILAAVLIVWMILFLKPSVGDNKQILYVRFSDVNKLPLGTRVTLAGKPIGELVAIEPIPEARSKPSSDLLGHLYYYQLKLAIDSHIKVYDTDEIAVQTSGLLGEKSIAIIPKPAPAGIIPQLLTRNQAVYAKSVDQLERIVSEFTDLSCNMQQAFREVTRWVQKNGEDVATAVRSTSYAMDEVSCAVHSINELKIPEQMQNTLQNFSHTLCDIQDAMRELEDADTFVNAGIMVKNFKHASCSIAEVSQDIANGRGTLGRLLKGDDLYLHFNAILSKMDTLMNDVNHYGILFHLNKSWQRQRLQRIVALNDIDTGAGFKDYFEDEVDNINTAMERISMLIDKMQTTPDRDQILYDPRFRKDFAELLRQADELSENLKLYNQQLIDAQLDP